MSHMVWMEWYMYRHMKRERGGPHVIAARGTTIWPRATRSAPHVQPLFAEVNLARLQQY